MESFPKQIKFLSDDTVANFISEMAAVKNKKEERRAVYRYQSGYYFKEKEVVLFLRDIEKLLGNGLIKID